MSSEYRSGRVKFNESQCPSGYSWIFIQQQNTEGEKKEFISMDKKNHHNLHKYVNLIAFGFKLSHIVIIPITKNNKKSFSFAFDAF